MCKKVLLGLSGGVDSAVAAYLLAKQGYQVSGCFMRNWDSIANNDILGNPTLEGSKCSQELDYDDAKKTAETLGIPLLRADFIEEYWDEVFTNFLSEYSAGRTPNPDVFCNRYIKFEAFRKYAIARGFDLVAMGHYAKRVDEGGYSYLCKAKDRDKDQSYFLGQITEEQLRMSLFPLAELTKREVRSLASELGLSVASKKDSTGVCFIGERRFRRFLQNYLPAQPGEVVDAVSKRVVGRHEGVYYYTLGQHRGLGIGGQDGFDGRPFFVVGKNVKSNTLYVAQEPNDYMLSYHAKLTSLNVLQPQLRQGTFSCVAKFRYRAVDRPVTACFDGEQLQLSYPGYSYVTPGQLAALYQDDRLIASGIIDRIYDQSGDEITF